MVAGALAPASGQPIWRVHFLAGYCSIWMSMMLMLVSMMMLMWMSMMMLMSMAMM